MLIEPFAQGNILCKPMHIFFSYVFDALFLFHMLKNVCLPYSSTVHLCFLPFPFAVDTVFLQMC